MLPESSGGVVDSRLNVYGMNDLRIVDASIFPLIPDGSIQVNGHRYLRSQESPSAPD